MDPRKQFFDDRNKNICFFCGELPDTRDHIPPKVFLDKPYPENLPVVECCESCNADFSEHEQYFACLLECIIHGTTEIEVLSREKIIKTLERSPKLKYRIENSKKIINDKEFWEPELNRLEKVILKLARGHLKYELGEPFFEQPSHKEIKVIDSLSDSELESIFSTPEQNFLPELGSHAFLNLGSDFSGFGKWNVVQESNYAYTIGQNNGTWVKLIIGEYLYCMVLWAR